MPDLPFNRRRFLETSLILGAGLMLPASAAANIHSLNGRVFINNRPVRPDGVIAAGDHIVVGHGGNLTFSLGNDAYRLRGGTVLKLGGGDNILVQGLRLLTGGLLAAFGRGERQLITRTATIGIRGTALYLNVIPLQTYFCTCYGETVLSADGKRETVSATHHNAHIIDFDMGGTMSMAATEVRDHTDDELRELEGLVGRVPAFDRG